MNINNIKKIVETIEIMNKKELKIAAPETSEFAEILTPEALTFVGELVSAISGQGDRVNRVA